MDTVIISALVAAVVSFVGVFINLIIAKQTREAAKSQLKFQSAIKQVEESTQILNGYLKEIESVRIACFELEFCFSSIFNDEIDLEKVKNNSIKFKDEFDKFFKKWADVKYTIEDFRLSHIRSIRHSCKNTALDLSIAVKMFLEKHRVARGIQLEDEVVKKLIDRIKTLSSSLITLYSSVNEYRNEKISEFMFD